MSTVPWKTAIEGQALALIEMLENAIRTCPPAVYDAPGTPIARQFWYLAFHVIFFLDRDLSPSPEAHRAPAPFTMDEMDPRGVYPDRTYTPEELLRYLAHARAKLGPKLDGLDDAGAAAASRFREEMSALEFLIHSLRHLAHHVAQLNLIMRQGGATPVKWVARRVAG